MAKRNYLVEGLSGTGKSAVYELPSRAFFSAGRRRGVGGRRVADVSLQRVERFSCGSCFRNLAEEVRVSIVSCEIWVIAATCSVWLS